MKLAFLNFAVAGYVSFLLFSLCKEQKYVSATSKKLDDVIFHRNLSDLAEDPNYVTDICSNGDWLETLNISDILYKDSGECQPCLKQFRDPFGNSSPRDLVIGFTTQSPRNLVTFIRTLRNAGSKASAVVFVDDEMVKKCTQSTLQVFRDCGLYCINLGVLKDKYQKRVTEIRHVMSYQLLKHFNEYFERALLVDVSDTFFQTDPFTTEIVESSLIFTTECIKYNMCGFNWNWILAVDKPEVQQFWFNKQVVNGGVLLGSVTQVLKTLSVTVSTRDYVNFTFDEYRFWGVDQPYFGMLAYRDVYKAHGINVTIGGPESKYSSMFHCKFDLHVSDDNPIMRRSPHNNVMFSILHQYNRYRYIVQYLKRVCPVAEADAQFAFAVEKQLEGI